MSFHTLDLASKDEALINRTIACGVQEAFDNAAVHDTQFAEQVRRMPGTASSLIWPVALNTEAEYEFAVNGGNVDPGGDESVITDGMILAAVQASWPPDPS